jgi:hypothetical protein
MNYFWKNRYLLKINKLLLEKPESTEFLKLLLEKPEFTEK